MDEYYKIIATISLQHDYFANRKLNGATITPFPHTQLFFRNYRMLFKKKNNQYVILQEASAATKEPTISLEKENEDLFFGINFNDASYQMRSGLNFDPRSEKIVIRTGDKEQYPLSEKNIMPCINSLATFNDEQITFKDENDQIVFSSETATPAAFNELPAGIYRNSEQEFLKCSNCKEFEAILILRLKPGGEPAERTITLPAGQYRWRYKVQKKYTKHHSLTLVDENENVKFKTDSNSDENVSVFLSSEPVALSELSTVNLVLYNSDNPVKKFLPLPNLDSARFLSDSERSMVLEAYITI